MSSALAVAFAAIAAFGGLAGFSAWRRVRSQNRVDNANASVTEATAADKWEKLYGTLQDRVLALETERQEMRAEAALLREAASNAEASAADARLQAQRSRTEKAEAETKVAELEAELARSIARAREERHALRGEFETWMRHHEAERVEERAAYETRIQLLEDRVETLSAQLGQYERRRTSRRHGDEQAAN